MNWGELKDFANSLPESELEKKVILWREDEVVTEIEAEQLEEDYYIDVNNREQGCFSKSEIKDLDSDTKVKLVYKKGNPILSENF